MGKLAELVRTIFVSPEFVIILIMIAFSTFWSDLLDPFRSKLTIDDDSKKWIALVPVGLLGAVVARIWNVILPKEDDKRKLHKWSEYWRVRSHCLVAIFYSVIFSLIGIASWLLEDKQEELAFTLALAGIIGALTTFLTVFLAEIRINEEFARIKNPDTNAD